MGKTYRWAQPVLVREQSTLFQPTLDDMLPQDHEVRLLDETLRTLDWSPWEAKYKRGGPGQPPIHPQVLAGLWLYAMRDAFAPVARSNMRVVTISISCDWLKAARPITPRWRRSFHRTRSR